MVVLGGLLAAAGLAHSALVPAWEAVLAGYAPVAGCANIVPVLFTAAFLIVAALLPGWRRPGGP